MVISSGNENNAHFSVTCETVVKWTAGYSSLLLTYQGFHMSYLPMENKVIPQSREGDVSTLHIMFNADKKCQPLRKLMYQVILLWPLEKIDQLEALKHLISSRLVSG